METEVKTKLIASYRAFIAQLNPDMPVDLPVQRMVIDDGVDRLIIRAEKIAPELPSLPAVEQQPEEPESAGRPPCGARKRNGERCSVPAISGATRCRMHGCGGRSASYRGGPKTAEGRRRIAEAHRQRAAARRSQSDQTIIR